MYTNTCRWMNGWMEKQYTDLINKKNIQRIWGVFGSDPRATPTFQSQGVSKSTPD